MASRRKSSTPCMLLPSSGGDAEDADRSEDHRIAEPSSRSYECKYCSFSAQTLKLFTVHADAVTDASYVCVACHQRTRR